MKTKLYYIAVLFLLVFVGDDAKAQTNVSGFISANTTWNLAGSPYIVVGNTLLSHGYTLTIEPGVVVKFETDKALQIDGELIAIGTPQNRITFTSNQVSPAAGDWANIHFVDTCVDAVFDSMGNYLSGSVMKYCDVLFGGGLGFGEIQIFGSNPYLSNCYILNSSTNGIYSENSCYILDSSSVKQCTGRGLYYNSVPSSLLIQHDTIENNTGGGIYFGWISGPGTPFNSYVKIKDNYFLSNSTGGAIYSFGPIYGTMIIEENEFINNSATQNNGIISSRGIRKDTIICNRFINNQTDLDGGVIKNNANDFGGLIYNNLFDGNSCSAGGYAVINIDIVDDQNPLIFSNNTVRNNSAPSGICCRFIPTYTSILFMQIHHNEFSNNTANSILQFDGYTAGNTLYLKFNNFMNPASQIEVHNDIPYGTQNIYADSNYWNSTNTQHIDSVIYDYFDFATQSVVYYSPILTSPVIIDTTCTTLPTGIISIAKSNNNLSIYPNPATNLLHLTLTKPLPPNTITITDMQGRVVKEVSKITPGGDAIDVSTLSQGVYLLKVNGQVQRFVKM